MASSTLAWLTGLSYCTIAAGQEEGVLCTTKSALTNSLLVTSPPRAVLASQRKPTLAESEADFPECHKRATVTLLKADAYGSTTSTQVPSAYGDTDQETQESIRDLDDWLPVASPTIRLPLRERRGLPHLEVQTKRQHRSPTPQAQRAPARGQASTRTTSAARHRCPAHYPRANPR
mmetsp:Transcript_98068/g.204553  ORF Transcript_98068/g.204553 Transcript_98068/m.204553 type:complete len:176 (+) Transcript_98068:136-663(+)